MDLRKTLEITGFNVKYLQHVGYVHRSGELLDKADEGSLFVKAIKA